ncbi:MAG TPA: MFS transporter [Verrucomicrobiae bacterium]|nr:MFS transporter [Verrucomicrobiae bacterium]
MDVEIKKQVEIQVSQPSWKQRWGWYLFDFANSILIINGTLYFPQWLVVDNKVSGSIYNLIALLTSILLIISAPFFGARADKNNKCFFYLSLNSLGLFISGLALSVAGLYMQAGTGRNVACLICFGAVLYFYQLSLVFYNALLNPLAKAGEVSKVSGVGLAWGWIGGIVAVIAIDPVVKGHLFFHTANRMNALLPSAIAFGILTALSLYLMRTLEKPNVVLSPQAHRSIFALYRDLKAFPILLAFIAAFFLYSDAILTLENNVTIFMEKVFGIDDDAKAMAFVVFLLLGAVAAGTEWGLSTPQKSLKALRCCMWGWVIALAVACFAPGSWTFYAVFLVMGILYGILYNSSRVLFFQLIPKEKIAEYFGLYASFERFASIIGPLLWSIPLVFRPQEDAISYRAAIGMLILPVVVSIYLLYIVRKKLDNGMN